MKILKSKTLANLDQDEPAQNIVEALIHDGWNDTNNGVACQIVNSDPDYQSKVAAALVLLQSLSDGPANMSDYGYNCRLAVYQIQGQQVQFFEKQRDQKDAGYATVRFIDHRLKP